MASSCWAIIWSCLCWQTYKSPIVPQLSFDKDNVFFFLCVEEKTKNKKTAKKIQNITVLSFHFNWSGDNPHQMNKMCREVWSRCSDPGGECYCKILQWASRKIDWKYFCYNWNVENSVFPKRDPTAFALQHCLTVKMWLNLTESAQAWKKKYFVKCKEWDKFVQFKSPNLVWKAFQNSVPYIGSIFLN